MQHKEGVFIVIEGSDGSGKSTQFKLLAERLEAAGFDVATFKFPQYNEPSSYFVKQYLAGAYGAVDEVGPYTASLFYALDRFAAADQIRSALAQGKVVLVDRFTGSNMAHQGTKFYHADQRRGYFIWLDNLEFEMLHIPRPDINFVLHVPTHIAQELLTKTGKKRDIHETNTEHLKQSIEVFNDLCQLFPKDFARIDSVRNEELLSPETINNLIWEKTFPLLPTQPRRKKAPAKVSNNATSVVADNSYIEQTKTGVRITAAGRAFLEKAITDTTSNIYAFNDQLQATTIAAAMVRASHTDGDVRTVLAHEFAQPDTAKDAQVKALADFGNESVGQLVGRHVVVEHTSQLLAAKIMQGRLGAYVTPSTQFMHYDLKDEHGQYKYYTPDYFKGQLAQDYRERMDEVFENYATIAHDLTRYIHEYTGAPETTASAQAYRIARAVLPVAARGTISVFASAQEYVHIIQHLMRDPLPESRQIAQQLHTAVQQVMPAFIGSEDEARTIAAYRTDIENTVKQLAETHLPDSYAVGITEPVTLVGFWPRNELDLVPDMLYEHSNLPLAELRGIVDKWPYEQKSEAFTAYIGNRKNRHMRPGRALEKAHYCWDIVCDYATFRDLQRHRMIDDLEWQQLTPRYGYEVPTLIEEAGLADLFEECFDISLELHSILHEADYPLEAQYATLFGHRLRWKVTYNAREAFHIHELRTGEQTYPETRKIVQQLHEKLAEVHPMIAEAMQFVQKN